MRGIVIVLLALSLFAIATPVSVEAHPTSCSDYSPSCVIPCLLHALEGPDHPCGLPPP